MTDIVKAGSNIGIRINLFEGTVTCNKCHKKFNLLKITKKEYGRYITRHMTNFANIDRHIRACQGE